MTEHEEFLDTLEGEEREFAADLLSGQDPKKIFAKWTARRQVVVLSRTTVEQLEELLGTLIRVGDGSQEDADILLDVPILARDAVNILPHLKLALDG